MPSSTQFERKLVRQQLKLFLDREMGTWRIRQKFNPCPTYSDLLAPIKTPPMFIWDQVKGSFLYKRSVTRFYRQQGICKLITAPGLIYM